MSSDPVRKNGRPLTDTVPKIYGERYLAEYSALLDVGLPKMNGIEVLRRIRSVDQALPVIIVTGLATKSQIAEARELGVTEVIEKSYVLKNFSESLARAVSKRPPPA